MGPRAPWSGTGLAIGSLTLAGAATHRRVRVGVVPALESLVQQFRVPRLGYRLVLALAGAAVALTVGFAGVTFVRLVGSWSSAGAGERGRPATPAATTAGRGAAVAVLVACPLTLAAVTPLEIRSSRPGCRPSCRVLSHWGAEIPVGPSAGVRRLFDPVTCTLSFASWFPGGFSKEISAAQATRVLEKAEPADAVAPWRAARGR